jgi:hypothetical protein
MYFRCCERDNLDGTLRRILTLKELPQKEHKGQGLWTSLKLLHGDLKQVRLFYADVESLLQFQCCNTYHYLEHLSLRS